MSGLLAIVGNPPPERRQNKPQRARDRARYKDLFDKATREADRKFAVHSAYKMGWRATRYQELVAQKLGLPFSTKGQKEKVKARAYLGAKTKKQKSIARWFEVEKWVDLKRPIKKNGKVVGFKPCGRSMAEGLSRAEFIQTYPYCRPEQVALAMSAAERRQAIAAKNKRVAQKFGKNPQLTPLQIAVEFEKGRQVQRARAGHGTVDVEALLESLGNPVDKAQLPEILSRHLPEARRLVRQRNPGLGSMLSGALTGLGKLAGKIAGPHAFKVAGVPVQFALTGPSVTFAPFSPFQKVSVDVFGSGARVLSQDEYNYSKQKGTEPQQNPPLALIGNPPPPEQRWEGSVSMPGPRWAQHTLDLIVLSADVHGTGTLVPGYSPPVVYIPTSLFYNYWRRINPGADLKSMKNAWDRWRASTRALRLHRDEAYDYSDLLGEGLPLDLIRAYDVIWAELGTPHPLFSDPYGVFPQMFSGEERERQILEEDVKRRRLARESGHRPSPSFHAMERQLQRVEEELERLDFAYDAEPAAPDFMEVELEMILAMRQEAVRQGVNPDEVAPFPPAAVIPGQARGPMVQEAGRPGRELRYAALHPEFDPGPGLTPLTYDPGRQPGPTPQLPPEQTGPGGQGLLFGMNPDSAHKALAELRQLRDPERKRRRNRDAKYKTPPEEIQLSLEDIEDHPDFELATHRYKRFHETLPQGVRLIRVPDGRDEVTRDPNLYVALHETLETPYVVPWESSKAGTIWFHEHPEDGRPLEVLNPRTGITSKVGGTYLIDEWWYS